MIVASFLLSLQFVQVPSSDYRVGKAGLLPNPLRTVHLAHFEIARTETTNKEFGLFVSATGYKTDAERLHNAEIFEPGLKEFRWLEDRTAYWRYPNGISRGGIKGQEEHPVTCISYRDAIAYCKWAGVRLPTLDEWEVACRAGSKTDYFWGEGADKIGEYANIWHGRNHLKSDNTDGYQYTSPVGSFKPNALGLYDTYGNVFEFCSGHLPKERNKHTVHARGGSWWCSKNACCFFNSVDIGSVNWAASFSNQGFRVARDVKP